MKLPNWLNPYNATPPYRRKFKTPDYAESIKRGVSAPRQNTWGNIPQPIAPYLNGLNPDLYVCLSLRKQLLNYSGPALLVRRDDGLTQSINYIGYDIDIAALQALASGGHDVGVQIWYDQSGNGNDYSQATFSRMPLVAISGSLQYTNGYLAMRTDSSGRSLQRTYSPTYSPTSYFETFVMKAITGTPGMGVLHAMFRTGYTDVYADTTNKSRLFGVSDPGNQVINSCYLTTYAQNDLILNEAVVCGWRNLSEDSNAKIYLKLSLSSGYPLAVPSDIYLSILGTKYNFLYPFNGHIQEFLMFRTNMSNQQKTDILSTRRTLWGCL